MKTIEDYIVHYERFLGELYSWEKPVLEELVVKGPERPNHLNLISNYPKAPANEKVYSRTICLEDIPFNENLDLVLSQLKRFGPYFIKFNDRKIAFVSYKETDAVQSLVEASEGNGQDRFQLRVRVGCRDITIPFRPWKIRDSHCIFKSSIRVEDRRSVFLSGIPLHYTAIDLGSYVSSEFGGVSYTELNTDELHYPKGTAIVVFHDYQSQVTALAATRLNLPDCKNSVTITPFFREDQKCELCQTEHLGMVSANASVFCADSKCFKYFCLQCWMSEPEHMSDGDYNNHPSFLKKGFQIPQSMCHVRVNSEKLRSQSVPDFEDNAFQRSNSLTSYESKTFQRSNSLTGLEPKTFQRSNSLTGFQRKTYQRPQSISSYEQNDCQRSQFVNGFQQKACKKYQTSIKLERQAHKRSQTSTNFEPNANLTPQSVTSFERDCGHFRTHSITNIEYNSNQRSQSPFGLENTIDQRSHSAIALENIIDQRSQSAICLVNIAEQRAESARNFEHNLNPSQDQSLMYFKKLSNPTPLTFGCLEQPLDQTLQSLASFQQSVIQTPTRVACFDQSPQTPQSLICYEQSVMCYQATS